MVSNIELRYYYFEDLPNIEYETLNRIFPTANDWIIRRLNIENQEIVDFLLKQLSDTKYPPSSWKSSIINFLLQPVGMSKRFSKPERETLQRSFERLDRIEQLLKEDEFHLMDKNEKDYKVYLHKDRLNMSKKFINELRDKLNKKEYDLYYVYDWVRKEMVKVIDGKEQDWVNVNFKYQKPHIPKSINKKSSLHLSKKKGSKIDLIRIINAMYELKFFKNSEDGMPTKKEVMLLIGDFLNVDLSNYDKPLSNSLNDRSIEINTKIFNDLSEETKKHCLKKLEK